MSHEDQLARRPLSTVLFLHGFTATPSEVEPTAEILRQKGFTVFIPLLPGHGTSPEDLNRFGWKDWFGSVTATLEQLYGCSERVIVAGLSMGGLLALLAAARLGERMSGAVSINAPIWASSWRMNCLWRCSFLLPPIHHLVQKTSGESLLGREAYSVYPLRALRGMLCLRKLVMRECHRITLPVSIIQSRMDQRVDPRSGRWLAEAVSGASFLELELSGHVATMGREKAKIVEAICQIDQTIDLK